MTNEQDKTVEKGPRPHVILGKAVLAAGGENRELNTFDLHYMRILLAKIAKAAIAHGITLEDMAGDE